MEYKEIIKKRKITSVAEDSELYYLENSKDYENTDNIEKRNKTENLSPKINNEHDKIFRKILSIKSETAKFINKTLDLTGGDTIKEEQLEKYTTRFITTNLYDKESDIIYKIKGRNIFILIEHQTQNDYKMPIRMLEYSLGIIKSAIDYKKITDINYKMPSVIPIVLYTGKTKWKAKRSISEKQQTLDRKNEQKYPKYNLVDVNNFTEEELIQEKTYISKIMLIEKHRNTEELIKYLKAVVQEVIKHKEEYNHEAEEVFVIMIKKILMKKIGSERVNEIIKKLKGVDEDMLTSLVTVEEENKLIFKNGKRESKIEIIKNMLKEKLPIDLISKVTGVSQKEINKMK